MGRPLKFDSAYEQNVSDVYGYLAFRGRSSKEAEDLTAETFERALKTWPRFDPAHGAEPRTWLLGIARASTSTRDGRAAPPQRAGRRGRSSVPSRRPRSGSGPTRSLRQRSEG